MIETDSPSVSQHYVWFDTEYSSLHLEEAVLLQIAATITDHKLQRATPAEQDINVVIRIDEHQQLSPWVQDTLPDLAQACRSNQAISLLEADTRLCTYLDETVGPSSESIGGRPVLAGNSVHADWFLARKFLPGFLQRLHYRFLDVTTIKLQWHDHFQGKPFDKEDVMFIRTNFPDARITEGSKLHDAHYDIQASIAELAYYRSRLTKIDMSS